MNKSSQLLYGLIAATLLAGCAAPRHVDSRAIIARMHAYCASLGYTMALTNDGVIGDDDTQFACQDGGTFYWFRWGDVK